MSQSWNIWSLHRCQTYAHYDVALTQGSKHCIHESIASYQACHTTQNKTAKHHEECSATSQCCSCMNASHCRACWLQDRINGLPLAGPHRLSSNDLLCSMLWHVSCLVRDRSGSSGVFNLMFDLRQMHVPDAYFGNAHCVLNVTGEV